MKKTYTISFLISIVIIFYACNNSTRDVVCENFELRNLDADSSLSILIPSDWDSGYDVKGYLSSEYKYYFSATKKDFKEGVVINRIKFLIPQLNLVNLVSYFKNSIENSYSDAQVHLIKEEKIRINNREIYQVLYSIKGVKSPSYVAQTFFINSDSTQTDIEIRTANIDTSVALNKINCILNSITIK